MPWASYPGPHIPQPIEIRLQGTGDLDRVCTEVLALTKMNFNSALPFGWAPITTRMAGEIGPILAELAPNERAVAFSYRYFM